MAGYPLSVRHLAISILVLATVAGCKRANTEPVPPAPGDDSSAASESETGKAKPDGCNDVDDCTNKGTMAFLAGDVQCVAMLDYSCSNDSGTACQNLSTALRSGTMPQDAPAAHAAALRGCKLGNASACVDLGVDESMGQGGATQDFVAAYEHFTVACEAGEPKGCRYVGVLFHEGSLGSPDPVTALKWFDVGCGMADPESCFNVGVLIIDGVTGEVDLEAASAYMVRACELGDQDGCAAIEKIAAAIEEQTAEQQTSKVTGANLQVGSATVNGFTVEALECRVDGGGAGLMGNMALLAALAERKTAIDKCGPKGTLVEVTWTAAGGKITKAEGVGSEGACVAKVLKKLATPVDGECAGTIVLGT
jgi:TPR repeat protein